MDNETHQPNTHHDVPHVKIYPPVVVTATIAFGLLMQFLFPLPVIASSFFRGIGFMLTIGAMLILWWSDVTFKNVGTHSNPTRATTDLVITGPHEYSRNPMYLAFLILTFGIGLWVGTLWLIILDIAQYAILDYLVVIPEEHYLSRKFGERYKRYTEKVRRWL
ncbi:MAG: isoprenylcysteine carboxylmethyltransferase family protein [Candidatus Paceibacterota bacterium]|jgi:protein-S-isoprenylcysteine O-methyltransferase Ste14